MEWSSEQSHRAIQLKSEGFTLGKIAFNLNREFNTSRTDNSVKKLFHRLRRRSALPPPKPPKPTKILFADIETSPLISYTWGIWEQNVIKKIKSGTILSVAYSWGGKTEVLACDEMSERELLSKLWKLLDEADVVVAHNGDAFDVKKINTRFIIHRFRPPSPYITIDTKKEIKKVAAFDSNSLDNLGADLDEGRKIKHRGFDMWEGCMAGNKKDWRDMKRYNKQDVELLKRIYRRELPWMKLSKKKMTLIPP